MKGLRRFFPSLLMVGAIRLVIFIYFSIQFNQNWKPELLSQPLLVSTGDTEFYLGPIERLVEAGGYEKATTVYGSKPRYNSFAGRMPGFLPIYGPLYFFIGKDYARGSLAILQFVAACFSVVLIARLAVSIFGKPELYFLVLFAYSLTAFLSVFDLYGYAESFAISFLIAAFYFSFLFLENRKKSYLLLSGLFAGWSVFMRPVLGIQIPILGAFLFFQMLQSDRLPSRIWKLTIFLLPFLVADGAWIIRNKIQLHRFIPLEINPMHENSITGKYSIQVKTLQNLVIAWGGNIEQWGDRSDIEWFFSSLSDSIPPYKDKFYAKAYNQDSLYLLKQLFHASIPHKVPLVERALLAREMVAMGRRFREGFKNDHPFHFYIGSRLNLLGRFLFPATIRHLPLPSFDEMKFHHLAIKLFCIFWYYLILLSGMCGIVWALIKNKPASRIFPFAWFPIFLIAIHAMFFGFIEQRYMLPAIPFLLIFSGYFSWTVISRFSSNRS